jgi:hypothetical protein
MALGMCQASLPGCCVARLQMEHKQLTLQPCLLKGLQPQVNARSVGCPDDSLSLLHPRVQRVCHAVGVGLVKVVQQDKAHPA